MHFVPLFAGRKKCAGATSATSRQIREGSEESSAAEDAPKIKDSRLESSPHRSPTLGRRERPLFRSPLKSGGSRSGSRTASPEKEPLLQVHHPLRSPKITDYFATSATSPLSVVCGEDVERLNCGESDGVASDQASDRSEGDSGKENDEGEEWRRGNSLGANSMNGINGEGPASPVNGLVSIASSASARGGKVMSGRNRSNVNASNNVIEKPRGTTNSLLN